MMIEGHNILFEQIPRLHPLLYRIRASTSQGLQDYEAVLPKALPFQNRHCSLIHPNVSEAKRCLLFRSHFFLFSTFRNRRNRGVLKAGILSNVFFLVTEEARVSYSQWRQHIFAWAIDPGWTQSGADEDAYDGRLKISATQIYFRIYEFMSTKKYTLKDIWRDFHQVNKTQTYVPGPLPAWYFTDLDKPVWPDS
ncbi:hypothetical protein BDV39DRAFT_215564 [Aspergillus sergii]|uniref:Uncharacterized protein n=1 Tax=Aspergillus sergii TaxID=1034303 RepID=A0A5N6X4U7_9EURO|nr:hypothetical protein BDV39DRAFT_215564 [Aspergillus sergii]